MLKQRVITAIILLLIFLATLLVASKLPFIGLMAIVITVAAWEWGKLAKLRSLVSALYAIGQLTLIALSYSLNWQLTAQLWLAIAVIWCLLLGALFVFGFGYWLKIPLFLKLLLGYLILTSAFLAIVNIFQISLNLLLSILLLVWVADSCAYFAGQQFATKLITRKLAPSISPGKSWEGAMGAIVGTWLLGSIWCYMDFKYQVTETNLSIYSLLMQHSTASFYFGLLGLVFISIAGDLFESTLKRCAGVKDSSNLLPGHGGVLDRIDALLPIFPFCLTLVSFLTLH